MTFFDFYSVVADFLLALPWWFLPVIFCLVFAKLLRKRFNHLPNIIKSYHRLNKFKKINDPRQQFGYLRYTNPYIYEEMILSALNRLGYKIIRNRQYSGDGGVDGKAVINGAIVLIQAKRYKKHINPKHIEEFVTICERSGHLGLFVHTGKTGPLSRSLTNQTIDIVSGQRMLELLNCRAFKMKVFKM